ncbi:TPA: DsbC family protein [Neisseria gonorrhoeae]
MKKKILATIAAITAFQTAFADVKTVGSTLHKLYPNTTFSSVKATPMASIYEVTMGDNIAYVQENGRYFIFGALYDMQEQKDLTEMARSAVTQKSYSRLPFKNAIKIVKGNGGKGKREFALFPDPDCPFCRRLEETLAGMTDYTAYVFMFPIKSLHPDAISKAEHIWCSKDREKAWNNYMLMDKEPAAGNCKNPVSENIALAEQLKVRGTPSMIHKDGRRTSGAMPRAELEKWLNGAGAE